MERQTWRAAVVSAGGPSARWGHAAAVAGDHLVIFGGYADSQYRNDLWSYHTATMQWQECATSGLTPTPRSNSTLHWDAPNRRLLLFGGGGNNKLRFNDVTELDWTTKEWTKLPTPSADRGPWERTYHSSELMQGQLVVFGGEGIADLDDLWAFDLQTHRWREPPIDSAAGRPCARRFHASAAIGSTLFVIAGCHDKYRCLSDVHCLDLRPFLDNPDSCPPLQWRELRVRGAAFLSRWGHSAAVLDERVFIFGGRFSSDLQDVLVLDPSKETLRTLKVQGETPRPRRRHSGNFVGSSLLVFGGFNGQYFRDLSYINLFEPPTRKDEPTSTQNRLKWLNSPFLADFEVPAWPHGVFHGHSGLLMDTLCDHSQFSDLLEAISGRHSLEELTGLFEVLYSGVGRIPEGFDLDHIDFSLFETEHERFAQLRRILTGESEQALLGPKGRQSRLLVLSEPLYADFLDSRGCRFSDLRITLREYCLSANRVLLASSSRYFELLLHFNQERGERASEVALEAVGDVRTLQVLLEFLESGFLVVPEGLDAQCWLTLLQTADYFCLDLRPHIEPELILRLNTENCEAFLELALSEGLQELLGHSRDLVMRRLLASDAGAGQKLLVKEERNAREEALVELYRLWEFDLQQTQLRQEAIENTKPRLPAAGEKENAQLSL